MKKQDFKNWATVIKNKMYFIAQLLRRIIKQKGFTIFMLIGVWTIVIQNIFILNKQQNEITISRINTPVEVSRINTPVEVHGNVSVGNTVDVTGSVYTTGSVKINNTVDVNLESINGYSDAFFNNPRKGDKEKYYTIPVVNFGY